MSINIQIYNIGIPIMECFGVCMCICKISFGYLWFYIYINEMAKKVWKIIYFFLFIDLFCENSNNKIKIIKYGVNKFVVKFLNFEQVLNW